MKALCDGPCASREQRTNRCTTCTSACATGAQQGTIAARQNTIGAPWRSKRPQTAQITESGRLAPPAASSRRVGPRATTTLPGCDGRGAPTSGSTAGRSRRAPRSCERWDCLGSNASSLCPPLPCPAPLSSHRRSPQRPMQATCFSSARPAAALRAAPAPRPGVRPAPRPLSLSVRTRSIVGDVGKYLSEAASQIFHPQADSECGGGPV